jgi:hypothetical protein
LSDANLLGANLVGANLTGVDLRQANLEKALLAHTNLSQANLEGAHVTPDQLKLVKKLEKAIMPDGKVFVPPPASKGGERGNEKRKATASGLAAALARIQGKPGAQDE